MAINIDYGANPSVYGMAAFGAGQNKYQNRQQAAYLQFGRDAQQFQRREYLTRLELEQRRQMAGDRMLFNQLYPKRRLQQLWDEDQLDDLPPMGEVQNVAWNPTAGQRRFLQQRGLAPPSQRAIAMNPGRQSPMMPPPQGAGTATGGGPVANPGPASFDPFEMPGRPPAPATGGGGGMADVIAVNEARKAQIRREMAGGYDPMPEVGGPVPPMRPRFEGSVLPPPPVPIGKQLDIARKMPGADFQRITDPFSGDKALALEAGRAMDAARKNRRAREVESETARSQDAEAKMNFWAGRPTTSEIRIGGRQKFAEYAARQGITSASTPEQAMDVALGIGHFGRETPRAAEAAEALRSQGQTSTGVAWKRTPAELEAIRNAYRMRQQRLQGGADGELVPDPRNPRVQPPPREFTTATPQQRVMFRAQQRANLRAYRRGRPPRFDAWAYGNQFGYGPRSAV